MKSFAPRRAQALTALAASALLLAACGGGKQDAGPPAPKDTSAATGTPSPKPTTPAAPYALTRDAHIAPGQDVAGRYRLARLLGTSGADVCVDGLLGPTPAYADGTGAAARKNQTAYEAAGGKVWAMLAHGTKDLRLADSPHYLSFLNDLNGGGGATGAISCQTDVRTLLTAFHKDPASGKQVSDGTQEIACASTVTATARTAAELTGEDPHFFGRSPAGRPPTDARPSETAAAGGVNFFLVTQCTGVDVPASDFPAAAYKRIEADNTTLGHNMLQAMRGHVAQ